MDRIRILAGICHGKTEVIFFKQITNYYLNSLYGEIFQEEGIEYEWNIDSPIVRVLDNPISGDVHVTVNSFEKDVINIFPRKNEDYLMNETVNNKSNSILFITLIDTHEAEEVRERRIDLINNKGHKNIIKKIFKENSSGLKPEYLHGSELFYFKKGIETHFIGMMDIFKKCSKKPVAMEKWIKEKIKLYDKTITTDYIKSLVIQSNGTNILEYFEKLDEIVLKIKEKLTEKK